MRLVSCKKVSCLNWLNIFPDYKPNLAVFLDKDGKLAFGRELKASASASVSASPLLVAVRRWDHREPELGIYSTPVL